LLFDQIPTTHEQYLAGLDGYLSLVARDWEDIFDLLEGMPGYLGEPRFRHIVGPHGLESIEIENWSFLSAPGENIFMANYFTLARLSLEFSDCVYCRYAQHPNNKVGYICGLSGHEYEECIFQKIGIINNHCAVWKNYENIINNAGRFLTGRTTNRLDTDTARLLNKHLPQSEKINH